MVLRSAFPVTFAAMTLCSVQTIFGGQADEDLRRMQIAKGIVAVIGLPGDDAANEADDSVEPKLVLSDINAAVAPLELVSTRWAVGVT
ncbi:hypothetical protein [Stieleria mannarensis]|uniref:hypothetical protein n=1 Tax=Stieleria mannarensis TaxID=2755585 RepID=UPI0015FF4FC9|nr:hypothetical protein [Rhodopirellula sp. JC639]